MKKLIALLLCGALAFSTVSLTGCKGNTDTTEETEITTIAEAETTLTPAEEPNKTSEIYMEITEVTSTSVKYNIYSEVYYLNISKPFEIDVLQDGEWFKINSSEGIDYSIDVEDAGYVFDETLNWKNAFGELPAGTYRIVRDFTTSACPDANNDEEPTSNKEFKLSAEFTIE